jgi:hypothetical protein
MSNKDRFNACVEYDLAFDALEWVKKIPHIKFPAEWEVQIIPPFNGALARFRVNNKVSIYLDGYDTLGYFGEPYWEVYPHEDCVFRCAMNDTNALISAINESLKQQKNEDTNARNA